MPLFAMVGVDKSNALQVRMGARENHIAYIQARMQMIKLAGPFLDANGDMAGSMIIFEAEDLAAAKAFSANDPYTLAGLWESAEVRPYKVTIGEL
jgi:uncharacterized protein YciI